MSIGNTARRGSRNWLTAGTLATIASIMIGGGAVTSCLVGENQASAENESQTYQQGANRIELDLFSGNVSVTAGQDDQVVVTRRLHWEGTRPTYSEDWSGETLRITGECPGDHEGCGIDYTLQVPAGVSVTAVTGAGDIELRGLTGEVHVDTGSGDATIDDISGNLWLHTGSGAVTARALRSDDTDIDTGSDDVDLSYDVAPSRVKVVTGSGEIRVLVPRTGAEDGYNVQAETGSGDRDILVRTDPASLRAISVSTGSGGITVDYA